jgi:hypothetical protein
VAKRTTKKSDEVVEEMEVEVNSNESEKEPEVEIVPEEDAPKEKRYCKEDILKSNQFSRIERDFLDAFLLDTDYSIAEANAALVEIKKGAVV